MSTYSIVRFTADQKLKGIKEIVLPGLGEQEAKKLLPTFKIICQGTLVVQAYRNTFMNAENRPVPKFYYEIEEDL
jgi:hypothetical protein